jgi:integrase
MPQPWKHPKLGTYYYRKVVPAKLRRAVGLTEIRIPLNTSSVTEAKLKYPDAAAQADAILARANGGSRTADPRHSLSNPEIERLSASYLHHLLSEDEEARVDGLDLDRPDTDIIGWKDALVASGLAPKTISSNLTVAKGFFRWAAINKKITSNPAAQVEYKFKRDPKTRKIGYSDEQARLILLAARKEADPLKRWAPWLCAFTGPRIDEVCGAMVTDVQKEGSIHYIRIDPANREEDASVKNEASIRSMPLHEAVIGEGFLKYVASLPKDGPLFPGIKPDRYGKRGGNGQKTLSRWIRGTVGIKNPRIQPSHAWRHRFADECRKVGVSREIRFSACIDEALPLLQQHYEEIALNKDITPLEPNWSAYVFLEQQSLLHIVTARDEGGKLVGYSAYILAKRNLHYAFSIAESDIFYLDPAHRKGLNGAHLLRFAEKSLRMIGVERIVTKTKLAPEHDLGLLLERLGFTPIERVYSKVL